MSKLGGPGLYEFLIEAELQQYYNSLRNELKVQNTAQLKYVTEDDLTQVGMSKPEIRRLKKYFQKHFPTNVLAKMKKFLSKGDNPMFIPSLSSSTPGSLGKYSRTVAPGRHIIQADSIAIHKTLGSGEFGTVQQGVWTDHDGQRVQVAIKCLSQERMENNPVEFLKEAAIMHSVDHEHIVRLYGVVLDTSSLMLVTELAPLRSLLECLKEPSMRPSLTIPTLYDFAIQISAGMEYLESKRLIHRDLAARNILVFSRSKVKISDFGLSRALGVGKDYYQTTHFNVNLKLPIAWCAPECINFLRFTSASDVWAFGVTLWEIFSYGFQPWAALTGQQILEAIDEPNFHCLEKPDCCPHEIYYQIMLKCWQHDANNRPTFAELLQRLLPECKPEQVQAVRESGKRTHRENLEYDVGDIISVLEKKPSLRSSEDLGEVLWKGALKDGRTGLFNPANTVTYLGSSFPTAKKNPFTRNDSRSSSLRKGRLSIGMISGPQGDLKHTGHVGPDGQFFGDLTFLGSKTGVPRQVVLPYKPDLNGSEMSSSDFAPGGRHAGKGIHEIMNDIGSSDTAPLLSTAAQMNMDGNDHEYHEISDEENEMLGRSDLGHSNPALSSKSQSPLDSPRFEKSFDLGGPSLIDEVFGALEQDGDEAHNVKNELRELVRSKKKFATVKPISSSDRKTLDHAIHLANELASRSMLDLDRPGKSGTSLDDISSPRTPNSPSHRGKFSFMLGGGGKERERRNYSQEAASIPDIQSTLTQEAKEAYNSLIEKPSGSMGFLTPSFENKSSFDFHEKGSYPSKQSEFFDTESVTKLNEDTFAKPEPGPSSGSNFGIVRRTKPRNLSLPDEHMVGNLKEPQTPEEVDENPLRLLRMNKALGGANVLPLPPRDRQQTKTNGTTFRHQRKHPLLIPSKVSIPSQDLDSQETICPNMPPPPPPKPVRQHMRVCSESEPEPAEAELPSLEEHRFTKSEDDGRRNECSGNSQPIDNNFSSIIENLRKSQQNHNVQRSSNSIIKLYENFEAEETTATEVQLKPRVPRGDTPMKTTQNANLNDTTQNVIPLNISASSNNEHNSQVREQELIKIKRILGNATAETECHWALNATNDAARAVKLLRLKSLLPESLLTDIGQVISALEMSHWDVARASNFLLERDKAKSNCNDRGKLKREIGSFNITSTVSNNFHLERDRRETSASSYYSNTSCGNINGNGNFENRQTDNDGHTNPTLF